MIEDIFIAIVILFLLPIFPMSLITNFLLSKLKGVALLFAVSIIFITGVALMSSYENKAVIEILSVVALFSTLFYALRLLSVSNGYDYFLFYYSAVSGFVWLWKSLNADMFVFYLAFFLPLMGFALLITFLDKQFGSTYFKAFKGLGTLMPRFSILLIVSVLGLMFIPYFPAFKIFSKGGVDFDIFYLVMIVLSWLLISWSGISMIEKLIYGQAQRKLHYKDLSLFMSAFLSCIYLLSIVHGFIYLGVILG